MFLLPDFVDNTISETTRRALADWYLTSGTVWSGKLPEEQFLARLYNLAELPSSDHRFPNAAGDIRQHRSHWQDWDADWVFYDARFNLLHAPDPELLRFLGESVHPIVRPNADEARQIVREYNRLLAADGWQLTETGTVSGRPVFTANQSGKRATVFETPTGWAKVDRQIDELRSRLEGAQTEEQYQTVGLLAREVLISASEAVFDRDKHRSVDGVAPSPTDSRRMLEAIFEAELAGAVNEEARAHAKAAVRLALALQHKRTADYRMAALCAEGTVSVVNLLAIVSGQRRQFV